MIEVETLFEGGVLRIVLNRPKANVIDAVMIGAIRQALCEVLPACRLIVFEGAGRHFSFGASVEEHQADRVARMLTDFHGLFRHLHEVGVPTCAVVRGQCLGGGLELAAWCTWIVAEPTAWLGQPEIKLGVFPPMATLLLPWRAGGRAALDLCVSGRSVSAEEAQGMGLINAVTDDVQGWWRGLYTDHLANRSAASLRHAERAVRLDLMTRLERDLPKLEEQYTRELMATHDANEGIAAFLQRRPATWRHQ